MLIHRSKLQKFKAADIETNPIGIELIQHVQKADL